MKCLPASMFASGGMHCQARLRMTVWQMKTNRVKHDFIKLVIYGENLLVIDGFINSPITTNSTLLFFFHASTPRNQHAAVTC